MTKEDNVALLMDLGEIIQVLCVGKSAHFKDEVRVITMISNFREKLLWLIYILPVP